MRAFVLALVLVLQFPVEPPEYPKGTMCTPKGDRVGSLQTPDSPCHCKRMEQRKECCGEDDSHMVPHEDPECKQFCHKDHCGCAVQCTTGPTDVTPSAPEEEKR